LPIRGLPLQNKKKKSRNHQLIRNKSPSWQLSTPKAEFAQLTPPLASAIAIIAAASITQERGFHMNPKNFKNFISCKTPRKITRLKIQTF